jgi:hypothetical protein
MQTNFKDVNFLNLRGDWPVEAFQALPPMVPFSGEVMAYLNALSKNPRQNILPMLQPLHFIVESLIWHNYRKNLF